MRDRSDHAATHISSSPYLDIWPEGLRSQTEDWLYPNMWPLRPENALPLATSPPSPTALQGLPHERTVYVTAGTTHNATPGLLETMLEGLREEAVNVVVTIGPDGDLDRFGPQPEHVRIERYIAQNTLLPHCEVVVCSAGAGTVLGALAHGIPLVVAPVATDQYEMAAQVEQAGAGRACSIQPLSRRGARELPRGQLRPGLLRRRLPGCVSRSSRCLRRQISSDSWRSSSRLTRTASLLTSRWLTPPVRSM